MLLMLSTLYLFFALTMVRLDSRDFRSAIDDVTSDCRYTRTN